MTSQLKPMISGPRRGEPSCFVHGLRQSHQARARFESLLRGWISPSARCLPIWASSPRLTGGSRNSGLPVHRGLSDPLRSLDAVPCSSQRRYDPGGPVLLLGDLEPDAIDTSCDQAASMGAVLVIVQRDGGEQAVPDPNRPLSRPGFTMRRSSTVDDRPTAERRRLIAVSTAHDCR